MPYNEKLADRIREALAHLPRVQEKVMFRGVCFMVNGKMCVCVGHDEMMCRFDPTEFETVVERTGCRPMIRNGKALKGYVFVSEEGWRSKKDFTYWIDLALAFNKDAKATRKKTKAKASPKKSPPKKKTVKTVTESRKKKMK